MSIEEIFKPAFEVIRKIEETGGEAYVVGGAVRDYLSGRKVNDIDIATSEPPHKIQDIFEKVIPVGIEHGTVIVRYHSISYEVTTYRVERGYEDFRHPDEVIFVSSITDDLARRDFTMNAMAMSRDGKLVDPFNGQEAIRCKIIEAVGEAAERFQEDPLRMLRAVRFASQLAFGLEKKTEEALYRFSHLLEHISIERISVETEKIFQGTDYVSGLKLLESSKLSQHLPLLNNGDILNYLPSVSLHHWHEIISFYVLQGNQWTVEDFMKAWRLSKDTKRKAEQLLLAYQRFTVTKAVTPMLVYHLEPSLFSSFSRLLLAVSGEDDGGEDGMRKAYASLPIHNKKELAFQAEDLMALHPERPKGRWIGEWMEQIEEGVVSGRVDNDYEIIKEWVRKWNPPARN